MKFTDIKPIDGISTPMECLDSISNLSKIMKRDQSSKALNSMRAKSMRYLLNLFEEYNREMEDF